MDVLEGVNGIVVPGGFGSRGIEGKILAAHFARTHQTPYLGLCLGMQMMVIEFGRFVLGTDNVNSSEFDRSTANPVIDLMPDQQGITAKGGTMRLGLYPCQLQPGSIARDAYGTDVVEERHPPSLRIQQQLSPALQRAWHGILRAFPGWASGRDRRNQGSPVHAGHAIPPRISLSPHPTPSRFRGLHAGCLYQSRGQIQ